LVSARGLVFVAAAALPVLAIPIHVFGWLPIATTARYVVLPLAIVAAALAFIPSVESWLATRGLVAGLLAVSAYDAVRMPLMVGGIWPDFIPDLGGWIIAWDQPDVAIGYLWRYLGDGGGIAIVFFIAAEAVGLKSRPVLAGVGYGILVWFGLMGTVLLAADGPKLLFPITPASFSLSLIGHLVYGSVVGWCYGRAALGSATTRLATAHKENEEELGRAHERIARGEIR
jgi:hypothetical protein